MLVGGDNKWKTGALRAAEMALSLSLGRVYRSALKDMGKEHPNGDVHFILPHSDLHSTAME